MNMILSILNIEFLVKDDAFKNWRMILFLSFLKTPDDLKNGFEIEFDDIKTRILITK